MFLPTRRYASLFFICVILLISCQQKSGESEETSKPIPEAEKIQTPFGEVVPERLIQNQSGAKIRLNEDGSTTVTQPDGTQQTYKVDDKIIPGSLPIEHEWVTSARFYAPEGTEVTQFYGNIVVPDNPVYTTNQVLYYFTGVQDNGTEPWGILQPVLGYIDGEWSLASWFCCPTGYPHVSNVVKGMQPGDTIYTSMTKHIYEGRNYYEIIGTWNDQSATLVVDTESGFFNWPNVTLEVYHIDSCAQFAFGEALFFDLALFDQDGKPIGQNWEKQELDVCGNNMEIGDDQISISQVIF